MIYQKDQKLLCTSGWVAPNSEKEVTDVPCKFEVKDYYAKPILALLIFSMTGDVKNPPAEYDESSGVLSRTYYFIPNE